MKKAIYLFAACLLLMSCKDEKGTYSELVEQERVKLEEFTKSKGYKVLNEFPEDHVFAPNEFVLLKNGIYIHVKDYGKGNTPAVGTKIQSKAKGYYINEPSKPFNGFEPAKNEQEISWPLTFKSGDKFFKETYLLSEGYLAPLEFVGDSAVVSLIIPFDKGSYYQNVNTTSVYLEEVLYVFEK